MAEARDATIGGAGVGGAAVAATDDEWDIHDRLKNLLSMFATSDHSCKYFGRSFFLFFFFVFPRVISTLQALLSSCVCSGFYKARE
jgi:hypothetical protein